MKQKRQQNIDPIEIDLNKYAYLIFYKGAKAFQ